MVLLDYRDARPIYTQITDGIRDQILSGILQEGDKLPSVRELATQLTINPNTIQRSYRELEMQGWIASVPGKGSFAGEKKEVGADRKAELMKMFDEAVRELSYLGVGADELIARIKEVEK